MNDISLQEYFTLATILNGELAGNETREICLRRILRGYHAYIEQAQANASADAQPPSVETPAP